MHNDSKDLSSDFFPEQAVKALFYVLDNFFPT